MTYKTNIISVKKKENDGEFIKNLLRFIRKNLRNIVDIFFIIEILGYVVLNSLYKSSAKSYYNIPREYFTLDISQTVTLLSVFFFLIVFFGFVYDIYNNDNCTKFNQRCIVIVLSMPLSLLCYLNLVSLLTFDINSKYIIIKASSLSIIFYHILLLIIFFIVYISIVNIISHKKEQMRHNLLITICLQIFGLFIALILYRSIGANIFNSVEKKRLYEIYYESGNPKVVITRVGDKYIVADCEIKRNDVIEEMNNLVIYLKNYEESSLDKVKRSYQIFRKVEINKLK